MASRRGSGGGAHAIVWQPLLLGLLLVEDLPRRSQASVLASSRLHSCLNNGSGSLACQSKMVLTVTLEHGQDRTETAQFLVREVKDDSEGTRQLQKPWRVSWTKTKAYWRYPLRYVQDVNAKPRERIIKVGWLQCSDNPLSNDEELTCGVAKLGNTRVPDSEGFCCGCDLADITGGIPTRGQLECSAFEMSESAHCLGFDPLWYSLFEVDRPQVFYDIKVVIARPDDPSADWSHATFYNTEVTLSHQQPVAEVDGGALRLELVGDFATATAPHRFESRYLAVPSRPQGHPRVSRSQPLMHAMLLDRSLFELSGRTCDKIGVSYTAFKRQSQKCERPSDSCLASQLSHMHDEDHLRLESGQKARYLVSSFCQGAVELGRETSGVGGSTRFLACPLEQRHTTVLRLEARADETMFVTNVASGRIVSAFVKPFEALQGGTDAEIIVISTGKVVADFVVGVSNCSKALAAAPAVSISLKPLQSQTQLIRLFTGQQSGGFWTCVASLYNSVGALLDERVVDVNVTDLQRHNGAQVPVERPPGTDGSGDSRDGGSCSTACPGFFDFICFFAHSCWGRLAVLLGVILGLVLLLACCCKGAKNGMLFRCLKCSSLWLWSCLEWLFWLLCCPSVSIYVCIMDHTPDRYLCLLACLCCPIHCVYELMAAPDTQDVPRTAPWHLVKPEAQRMPAAPGASTHPGQSGGPTYI